MDLKIEKQIDELNIEKWTFYVQENKIYLDTYYRLTKETKKKRNYKTVCFYNRLRVKESSISESEVPFSEEFKKEVIEKFTSQLKVLKWSEKH